MLIMYVYLQQEICKKKTWKLNNFFHCQKEKEPDSQSVVRIRGSGSVLCQYIRNTSQNPAYASRICMIENVEYATVLLDGIRIGGLLASSEERKA